MAVLRDVPFSNWAGTASLNPFIAFLNTLEHDAPTDSEGKITLGTVFRGAGVDEEKGSNVSQYLLLPFTMAACTSSRSTVSRRTPRPQSPTQRLARHSAR